MTEPRTVLRQTMQNELIDGRVELYLTFGPVSLAEGETMTLEFTHVKDGMSRTTATVRTELPVSLPLELEQ
jgi:hypothetical protein